MSDVNPRGVAHWPYWLIDCLLERMDRNHIVNSVRV